MKEVLNIREFNQAKTLMSPIRIRLVQMLSQPQSCAELSEQLKLPQQRVNHHLKELLKVKLIRIASTRKVRNLLEATYQAVGKCYWVSPRLFRSDADEREFRDQLSLSNLLVMTESIQEEVGQLLELTEDAEVPSIGISAEISLSNEEERNEFSRDLLMALESVIKKYHKRRSANIHAYSINLMCYPKPGKNLSRGANP